MSDRRHFRLCYVIHYFRTPFVIDTDAGAVEQCDLSRAVSPHIFNIYNIRTVHPDKSSVQLLYPFGQIPHISIEAIISIQTFYIYFSLITLKIQIGRSHV